MSEVYEKDESIHEPTTAHLHPLETTPQGSQAEGAPGRHEHRDVSFGALAKWFTGLFIGVAISFVLMIWFFNWAVQGTKSEDEMPSSMYSQRDTVQHAWPGVRDESPLQKPGAMPVLLPEPEEPMKKLRAEEDDTLSSYNWAKDEKGHKTNGVTIPIERAIDLTVQRGLPSENKTNLRPMPAQAEVVRPGEIR